MDKIFHQVIRSVHGLFLTSIPEYFMWIIYVLVMSRPINIVYTVRNSIMARFLSFFKSASRLYVYAPRSAPTFPYFNSNLTLQGGLPLLAGRVSSVSALGTRDAAPPCHTGTRAARPTSNSGFSLWKTREKKRNLRAIVRRPRRLVSSVADPWHFVVDPDPD